MLDYEKTGVLTTRDLKIPTRKQLEKGVAIIECIQEIPCDPCVESCPVNAISMKDVNAPPIVDYNKCIGCRQCIGICPGLAIFVVKNEKGKALVTLPYEFLPVPEVGETLHALNREGKEIDKGTVKKVVGKGKTMVITVEVKEKLAMDVRNIRV